MSWNTPLSAMTMITGNDQVAPDVYLIFENKKIGVHKDYLSLVSPVFKAMFAHNTKEAKTGKVPITDFSYDIAKSAIDFVYGIPIVNPTVKKIFEVYTFLDKYDIKAACKQLSKYFDQEIDKGNLCIMAKYAWMFSKGAIIKKCVNFLASHNESAFTSDFVQLDPKLVISLLKDATTKKNEPKANICLGNIVFVNSSGSSDSSDSD